MYIREIKKKFPKLYERIISQLRPEYTEETAQSLDVNKALLWHSTLEGSIFWDLVYFKKWDAAKKLYPEYFETAEDNKNHMVQVNGLFKVK